MDTSALYIYIWHSIYYIITSGVPERKRKEELKKKKMIIEQRPALFLNHTHNQHNSSPSFLFCLPSVTLFLFFFSRSFFIFWRERERESLTTRNNGSVFWKMFWTRTKKKSFPVKQTKDFWKKELCKVPAATTTTTGMERERERNAQRVVPIRSTMWPIQKGMERMKKSERKKERTNGRNCDSLWMCVQIRQAKRTHLDGFFFLFPTLFSPLAIFFFFAYVCSSCALFFYLNFKINCNRERHASKREWLGFSCCILVLHWTFLMCIVLFARKWSTGHFVACVSFGPILHTLSPPC